MLRFGSNIAHWFHQYSSLLHYLTSEPHTVAKVWPAKVFVYLPQETSMCILRVLYKTLWNYINAIIWRDCHDYIGKIWTLFSHIVMLLLSREQSCQYYTCTLRQRFVNIAVYFFRADLKLVSIHDILPS